MKALSSYKLKSWLPWILVGILGLFLRLWHNDFGLPHSFYADEPEFIEFAIKYTYEIRSVVANGDWYKLIPVSYVYGTFPTYLMTIATVGFSKTLGILGVAFEKMHIYIFLRTFTGLLSFLIVPAISYLYYKMFEDKFGALLSFVLLSLNWKLIVHAHYANADIVMATLLSLSFLTAYLYYNKKSDHLFTILTGILVGLAIGTKITVLIGLPLYVWLFLRKRDTRGLVAFCFIVFGAFIFTNPFSIIFINDFLYRVYSMFSKEAGLVFDSANSNPFKYILGLSFISTAPILLTSLYGKILSFNFCKDKNFRVFLILNVLIYLVFYSLQGRRVDRWLLPVLPIVVLFSSYGISRLREYLSKPMMRGLLVVVFSYSLFLSGLLLFQFQSNTPKSAAYIWMQENLDPAANKLVYTEEGLDPVNKLPGARVIRYNVYESENAQYFLPENPEGYHYVVLSSRPMSNFKREEVSSKYPFYAERWEEFENTVTKSGNFRLLKSFTLPKPNLIPLSDVFIYENQNLPL